VKEANGITVHQNKEINQQTHLFFLLGAIAYSWLVQILIARSAY
jgi:hypothetical protein